MAATARATATATTTTMTLCRGTLLGPPPTGHVRRFIDSGVFVLPVGGPSRSLLEVRGAPWVALPALICSFEAAASRFKFDGNFVRDLEHLQAIESLEKWCFSRISEGMVEGFLAWSWHFFQSCLVFSCRQLLFSKLFYCQQYCQQEKVVIGILLTLFRPSLPRFTASSCRQQNPSISRKRLFF